MCNFRNVCKTLATRNQVRQAFAWLTALPTHMSDEAGTGNETITHCHSEFIALHPATSDR